MLSTDAWPQVKAFAQVETTKVQLERLEELFKQQFASADADREQYQARALSLAVQAADFGQKARAAAEQSSIGQKQVAVLPET